MIVYNEKEDYIAKYFSLIFPYVMKLFMKLLCGSTSRNLQQYSYLLFRHLQNTKWKIKTIASYSLENVLKIIVWNKFHFFKTF